MFARALWIALITLSGSFALGRSARAQGLPPVDPPERVPVSWAFVPLVFEGLVLEPDGAPAAGAVVASSAGGRAVTQLDGRYRLEVQVPPGADRLEITAVVTADGENDAASTIVGPLSGSGITCVEPLVLALGISCHARWQTTFGNQPGGGVDGEIRALAVFDDGRGPALYAGGSFLLAGGVAASHVAKWDGTRWSALGSGTNNDVHALTVFDDGSGPALYAGGSFRIAGGELARRIAKWNGSSWSSVGRVEGTVRALTVFDDGNGPQLYAGGDDGLARWDGSRWLPVGSRLNGPVRALAVFDDGDGPALYAGGEFNYAGTLLLIGIARWDGASWSALGSGMGSNEGIFPSVTSLAVFAGDTGAHARDRAGSGTARGRQRAALYAGGLFSSAGGVPANRIAKWDGSSWSALGSGMSGGTGSAGISFTLVNSLTVFDDGGGLALFAGGNFTSAGGVPASRLARWDGRSWSSPGTGLTHELNVPTYVNALAVFDDGHGPALCAGGNFSAAGGRTANRIASWNGSAWSPLRDRLDEGLDDWVSALRVFDDGTGPALYVGGGFTTAGGQAVNRIAKWDGSSWSPLGSGMSGGPLWPQVGGLQVFDDGGGPALYAGGSFKSAGGVAASCVARWDGSSWSRLGSGMAGGTEVIYEGELVTLTGVRPLEVFDDGSGPALYAGGVFTSAGGVAALSLAKWDGARWASLGSGVSIGVFHPDPPSVKALIVFDDGTGPALYVGGDFLLAGGAQVNQIAKWDGVRWSSLGGGVEITYPGVTSLAVFDDGNGSALYVGGGFTTAGGAETKHIARWDGSFWSPVGLGMQGYPQYLPQVNALLVFDDGRGPSLYASGFFTSAEGLPTNHIARWNGFGWRPLGSGTTAFPTALAVFDDGRGPDLYVGGGFWTAFESGDSFLARWGCPIPATTQSKVLRR